MFEFFISSIWQIMASIAALVAAEASWASVKIIKKTRMDDFMPIIMVNEPNSESEMRIYQHVGATIELMNMGKGVARNIMIRWNGKLLEGNYFIVSGGKRQIRVPADDKKEGIFEELSKHKEVWWSITYDDIYDRHYETRILITREENFYKVDRAKNQLIMPK